MFYAPWADSSMQSGVWRIHINNYNFAQCLKVPLRTCKILSNMRKDMEASREGGIDEILRVLGGPLDWKVGVHYPGLVQHIGSYSAVGETRTLRGYRSSRSWMGADFDAMSLIGRAYNHVFR